MIYRVSYLRNNGCVLEKNEVLPSVVANVVWRVASPERGSKYGRFVQALMVEGSAAWCQDHWPPLFDPQVTLMDEGMAIAGTQFSHAVVDGKTRRHEHTQVWWCERASDAEVETALVRKPRPKDYGHSALGREDEKPASQP